MTAQASAQPSQPAPPPPPGQMMLDDDSSDDSSLHNDPDPTPAQAKQLVADLSAFCPRVASLTFARDVGWEEGWLWEVDEEGGDGWGVLMAELAAAPLRLRELLFMVERPLAEPALQSGAFRGIQRLIEQGLGRLGLVTLEPWMGRYLSACTSLELVRLIGEQRAAAVMLPALRHLRVSFMPLRDLPFLLGAHLPALRCLMIGCKVGLAGSLALPPAMERSLSKSLRELTSLGALCPLVRDGVWTLEWRDEEGAEAETVRRRVGRLAALPRVWQCVAREPRCAGLKMLTLLGFVP